MKETNIIVSVIVGAELEQVSARDARTGKLLFAGNRDAFCQWFNDFTEPSAAESADVAKD